MGLNDTASGDRIHIGFFGRRNAGKSSVVNAVTGQSLSVVSDIKGTTTDPVRKAMELLPLGPVVIIDTPGFDDEGELGEMRVSRTRQVLSHTDIAVLVIDSQTGFSDTDKELTDLFGERQTPYITVFNKCDITGNLHKGEKNTISVSAATGENIKELKELIASFAKAPKSEKRIVADLLTEGDSVLLVTPIDESAPKGRLILPQQQTIRDILDSHCTVVVCQDTEVKKALASLSVRPRLVITDSQAFGRVSEDTPDDIPLTSFSILFARYKGDLSTLVKGAAQLKKLKDGDKILIAEGCTHHRQCNDIGTVKMPAWIRKCTGKNLEYHFTSGGEFPDNLSDFALIVHCGACMLNEKEMKFRLEKASSAGVPIVNYGIAIAEMHGILKRSLEPFPDILRLLDL